MRIFFLFLFPFFYIVFGEGKATTFVDAIKASSVGDYAVYRGGKILHFIRVIENNGKTFSIEEMTLRYLQKQENGYKYLYPQMKDKCIDHLLLKVDVKNPEEYLAFSLKENRYLQFDEKSSIFLELLSKELHPVPEEEKRKVGILPKMGPDTRKTFIPTYYYEGKEQKNSPFSVYKVTAPKNAFLKNKHVILYFQEDFSLPYWILLQDPSKVYLQLGGVDSGKGFLDHLPKLEEPEPFLTSRPLFLGDEMTFSIYVPSFQTITKITDMNNSILAKKDVVLETKTRNYLTFKVRYKNIKSTKVNIHFTKSAPIIIPIEK